MPKENQPCRGVVSSCWNVSYDAPSVLNYFVSPLPMASLRPYRRSLCHRLSYDAPLVLRKGKLATLINFTPLFSRGGALSPARRDRARAVPCPYFRRCTAQRIYRKHFSALSTQIQVKFASAQFFKNSAACGLSNCAFPWATRTPASCVG